MPLVALAALLAVPLASIAVELAWYPAREIAHADHALLELNTLVAARGELVRGAYSRYGWSHPGPLAFYLAAPAYLVGGRTSTSLNVFAGVWSWVALVTAAGAWFRAARRPAPRWAFVGTTALILVAMSVGFPLPAFTETWNPALALLPFWTLLVIAALVVAGRRRWLPLAVFLHAVVAQSHIGSVLPATSALLLAASALWCGRGAAPRETWRIAWTAIAVAAVCWAPVVWDAIRDAGGNAAQIVEWVLATDEPRDPQRWSVAVRAFARPVSVGLEALGAEAWVFRAGVIVIAALVGGAAIAWVRRPRHPLTNALLLSTVIQLVTAALNLALMRGPAYEWLVLWLIPICGVSCLTVLCALAEAPVRWTRRGAGMHLAGLLGALALGGAACHHELSCGRPTQPTQIRRAAAIATCLLRETATSRPHVVLVGADAWREAAGVTLGLVRAGVVPVMDPEERYRFGAGVEYERGPDQWFRPTLTIASAPYCDGALERFGTRCLTAGFLLHPAEPWARRHLGGDWSFQWGRAATRGEASARVPLFPRVPYDLRVRARAPAGATSMAVVMNDRPIGTLVASATARDFRFEVPASTGRAHALALRATEGSRIEIEEIELTPRAPPRCVE